MGKGGRRDGKQLASPARGLLIEVANVEGTESFMTGDTKNTPGALKEQAPVHTHCANFDQGGQSMHMAPRDEDQGLRLDQALAARGLNRSKLAKKVGVSASSAQKWFNALSRGDITESMWHSCARALQAVGIDPADVRPGAKVPSKTAMAALVGPIMAINDRTFLHLLLETLSLEDSSDRETLQSIVKALLMKLS